MSAFVVSGIVFAATFAGILTERAHRTILALAGAALMVLLGLAMGFYSQEGALEAIDFNTLALLLGMMILVSMLRRTGFFEYLAILTAKRSGGSPWFLLVTLGTVTTVASAFLDNVTTVILIAPVTILVAEILGINPVPLLIAEALLSNTGGVATLVGDPPNILIGSAANLSFVDFLVNVAPIVLVAWLVTLLLLRFLFRKELAEEPQNVEALLSLDEDAALHDRPVAARILIILSGVVLLFFVHHVLHLQPGFIAMLGAALALLWIQPDIEEILEGVEWTVLLFFAALFVVVGGLEASGLLGLVGENLAGLAGRDLLITGVALIWVAAVASAIVDNIPFTIAMIPLVQELGGTGVNVTPLWWALALGAGFGGNGTPIGSTANVVVVSLSERTKTPITAAIWLRNGLPVMAATCTVGSILYVLAFRFLQ